MHQASHGPYAWADEFRDMANGILAKHAAAQRATARVVQAAPPVKTLEQLHAELAEARCGFDPAYQFADDYSVYCAQLAKASRIEALTAQIRKRSGAGLAALMEQGLELPYPLRNDAAPRAVFRPASAPLILEGEGKEGAA